MEVAALTPSGLGRIFDVRRGEGQIALAGLAVLLLLLIAGHTMLETARDALLLTGPGPRALGVVYMAIAACTIPCAALAARTGARFGVRRTLGGMLALAAASELAMFLVPPSRAFAMAVYVLSGVIGSVLVPQFWTFVGTVLTSSQGRRLFGLIAAAGVVGGVVGSGAAAAAILFVPVRGLLVLSAVVFAAAGAALTRIHVPRRSVHPRAGPNRGAAAASLRAVRDYPFLIRVALVVFLSTATLLALDYFFKSSIARALPRGEVAGFVARYYLALNGMSLVVQLFGSSTIVRSFGVAAALILTPLLILAGATASFLAAGALLPVLLTKGVDGSLRYSLHRVSGELVYLPVPAPVRGRAKPFIDGALARLAQAVTGATLLALGGTGVLAPRPFAAIVAFLAAAWLVTAISMRTPYLALLRRAISSGALETQDNPDPIDLESAEILVQHLASEDPLEVVGAMGALARRRREGLVSALVLLHTDETVLRQALEIFGASDRTDWIPLARRLLDDPRELLRIAAARALAMHGQLDAARLANGAGSGPRAQGYAAVYVALRDGTEDLLQEPRVTALLRASGQPDAAVRLGMLAALADAEASPRASSLLARLALPPTVGEEPTQLLARAAARQGDALMVPHLVALLSARAGREAVRASLVTLGQPALDAVVRALADETLPRRLRAHLPKTLARFGTKRAAEGLLRSIETEQDGLVRYKSIRALGVLVTDRQLWVDRRRVEELCRANVARHFRVLGLATAVEEPGGPRTAPPSAAEKLLRELLRDKVRQSLERAFLLLKIAHPAENVRRIYLACVSDDVYARANAAELIEVLLPHADQKPLRALLGLVADDLPAKERLARAQPFLPHELARDRDEALTALLDDPDVTLATLAALHARELDSPRLHAAVEKLWRARPEIVLGALLDEPHRARELPRAG